MHKTLRFWLGAAISAVFLGLFFWKIDPRATVNAIKEANYWWLAPAVGAYFIAVLFRTLRWHYLLLPMKSIRAGRLYPIVVIGYMANNLLPVRLGEFVRAFFVGQKEGVSKSAALATIIIERVFDGVFLLILALVVWPFLPVADLLRDFAGTVHLSQGLVVFLISAPFILVTVVFFAVAFSPALGHRLVGIALAFVPGKFKGGAERLALGFIDGLASLRSPRRVLAVVALTAPVWLMEALMYYLIALGFHVDVPFHGILMSASASNLATSLPSSAGGVGPFELITKLSLQAMNVSGEVAAAYAIVLHVALLAPVTLLGLFFLWQQNVSFGEVARQSAKSSAEAELNRTSEKTVVAKVPQAKKGELPPGG